MVLLVAREMVLVLVLEDVEVTQYRPTVTQSHGSLEGIVEALWYNQHT